MTVFKTSLLATALLAATAIAPAYAANNDTFDVTITIEKSCDVTATQNVAFADSVSVADTVEAQGSVSVKCTNGADYNVALNGGATDDVAARQMSNGTDTIAYQLYQDAALGDVWGETTGTDTVEGTGTGFTGNDFDHVVYAQATLTGDETAGDYTDTITATVSF